jgi:hypothetical protein
VVGRCGIDRRGIALRIVAVLLAAGTDQLVAGGADRVDRAGLRNATDSVMTDECLGTRGSLRDPNQKGDWRDLGAA